jgi:tetratricopeptide (TPR) repeat protein
MEKAQKLAPQNIERILNIADIHFELGQVEQSQQALNQAMDLDPGSEAVKGLQAQIAIETGDLDEAGEIMNDLTVIDNVVRDMNNRAVAYAKNGRYTDSIRLYQDTLRVIPRREGQIKRSVQYNLCLSYVKYGELENALSVIRDLDTDGKTPIELKIASLRTKIQRTLKEGFTLKVDLETHAHAPDDTSQSVQDEEDAEDIDNDELLANESSIARDANMSLLEATRGDICCHLIYFDIQGISPDVDRLRQTLPHFRPRQSLQKTV